MAPVVVVASQATANWGADPTVSRPTGTTNGDLMLAAIVLDGDSVVADITTPSGWTPLGQNTQTGTYPPAARIFWRIANNEPASYTFPRANSSASPVVVGIVTIRGHATSNPLPASLTWGNGTGTNVTAPSVAGVADGLVVTVHATACWDSLAYSFTPPAGMTEWVDITSFDGWCAVGINSGPATAAATGARTAVQSGPATGWSATAVVVKPTAVAVTGAIVGTLPSPTGSASGTVRTTGQITATTPAPAGTLTGATHTTGALAGTLPAPSGTATGTTSTGGAVDGTGPAPIAELAGAVTTSGTLAGTSPAATGEAAGTVTVTGAVDTDTPAPTGELAGLVTATGTLAATGPAPTAALTGTAGSNWLTGTLAAPVAEFTGTTSTTGALAGTLPAPSGEFTASNDVTGQIAGTLPSPTATVTGTTTVTGTLTGTLPAPEFTGGVGTSERDIALVANLAPAAWHSLLADGEWRPLLAAEEWAGGLQAQPWLGGLDEQLWAVTKPWITTPGEAGPSMRLNSKEFVKVTVTPSKDPATGTPLDISADEVEMCVTLATHPEELDWQPAAWVGTADPSTGALACRLLVQPSALGLTANSQPSVFVRVHDNPEVPVLKAGQLSIS